MCSLFDLQDHSEEMVIIQTAVAQSGFMIQCERCLLILATWFMHQNFHAYARTHIHTCTHTHPDAPVGVSLPADLRPQIRVPEQACCRVYSGLLLCGKVVEISSGIVIPIAIASAAVAIKTS